jgi:hypothetical protein
MNSLGEIRLFWAALWCYLNQPLFEQNTRVFLNPLKFDYPYKIQHLERCWVLDYDLEKLRNRLEKSWQ